VYSVVLPAHEIGMIIHLFLDLLCLFSHAFFSTSLCVLRTHIESRFCNPHIVILHHHHHHQVSILKRISLTAAVLL
jgi:hypothetical protein